MNISTQPIWDRVLAGAVTCRDHPWVPLVARFVAGRGQSGLAEHSDKITLFLVLCLLAYCRRGLVFVAKDRLIEFLGIESPHFERLLADLATGGHIAVREPGPYLVITIGSWPGGRREASAPETPAVANLGGKPEPPTPPSTPPPGILPFWSGRKDFQDSGLNGTEQTRSEIDQDSGEGVRGAGSAGEGADALDAFLDRLVKTTGASHERASYRSFCRKYPLTILNAALGTVAATPTDKLKKSAGAYFVYLVKKLDRTQHP